MLQEKQEEACYADPAQKKYSHDQLKASQGRAQAVWTRRHVERAARAFVRGMPRGCSAESGHGNQVLGPHKGHFPQPQPTFGLRGGKRSGIGTRGSIPYS